MYGILITLCEGVKNEILRCDVKYAFSWIGRRACDIWKFSIRAGKIAGKIGYYIPVKVVATILHHLVFGVVFLLFVAVPIMIILYGLYKLAEAYYCDCWDIISIVVVLINIAVIVSFGTIIRPVVQVNLLLVFVLIQILYVVIRELFDW